MQSAHEGQLRRLRLRERAEPSSFPLPRHISRKDFPNRFRRPAKYGIMNEEMILKDKEPEKSGRKEARPWDRGASRFFWWYFCSRG